MRNIFFLSIKKSSSNFLPGHVCGVMQYLNFASQKSEGDLISSPVCWHRICPTSLFPTSYSPSQNVWLLSVCAAILHTGTHPVPKPQYGFTFKYKPLKKKKLLLYSYSFSSSFISCWLYWRTFTTSTLACFKLSFKSKGYMCLSTLYYAFLCCPKIYSTSMFYIPKYCTYAKILSIFTMSI